MHTPRHDELGGGTVIPRPRCTLPLDDRSGVQENILPCACMDTRIPLYEIVIVLLVSGMPKNFL
jgi:hypothetical protein